MNTRNDNACGLGDFFSLSFVIVVTAAMVTTIATWADPLTALSYVIMTAIAVAGLGTAAGMIAVHHDKTWLLLWLFMGVQTGLALEFISYGFGALFILVITFVWMAGESRRRGVPIIGRWGLVAELIGFALGTAPLLIALS